MTDELRLCRTFDSAAITNKASKIGGVWAQAPVEELDSKLCISSLPCSSLSELCSGESQRSRDHIEVFSRSEGACSAKRGLCSALSAAASMCVCVHNRPNSRAVIRSRATSPPCSHSTHAAVAKYTRRTLRPLSAVRESSSGSTDLNPLANTTPSLRLQHWSVI